MMAWLLAPSAYGRRFRRLSHERQTRSAAGKRGNGARITDFCGRENISVL